MSALTVYLGPEDKGVSLDSPLGAVGDRGTITIDSETMTVVYGFGTTYLFVERGDDDSSRVGHVIGTTVTASISGGGSNPATLSRLRAHQNTSPNGINSGVETFYDFDTVDELVGTDIEVDDGDSTRINILTDGVYAIGAPVTIGGTALTAAYWTLYIDGAGVYFGEGLPDAYAFIQTVSVVRFVAAGTVLRFSAAAENAGTFSYNASPFTVQRVA